MRRPTYIGSTLRSCVVFGASSMLAFLFALSLPFSAHAATCGLPALSANGYFFTNHDAPSYGSNGFLNYHLKINSAYASGRPFRIGWSYLDDDCAQSGSESAHLITLPFGVTDWSIRFSSATHVDVWDDQNNAIVTGFDVRAFPGYTHPVFFGNIDGNASTFTSRALTIKENAASPSFTSTLPLPAACAASLQGSTGGSNQYFFDANEHAEYVDGFLRLHLRLKTPYNDGRPFRSAAVGAAEDCAFTFPSLTTLNTGTTPRIRYYSFRMSSATHWQLWDDESNQALTCDPGCSGDITSGSAYVIWLASIDGSASTIQTTPFAPVEAPAVPDPVIIIPGILGSRIKHGVWTLDPVQHTYDNLVETLLENGYAYDQSVFTFPYDWTQSNEITARELKMKIDTVKMQTSATKVDLVAHSMGGLVARKYIQSLDYGGDVDQLIFLGTPHLGAPLAYLMYEDGKADKTREGFFFSLYLEHLAHEAGFDNAFDYIHLGNIESVRQLLPIYDYLFNEPNQLLDYPSGYPTNLFLENLTLTSDQLALTGVEVTNIIGDDGENGTLNSLNIEPSTELPLWLHGVPTNLNRGAGDGTVPLFSAAPTFIGSSTTLTSGHTSLPTDAEGLVYSILTGKTAINLVNTPLFKRFFIFRVFSPIDIQITAPSGARIGKDFDTGDEFEEIPGAFYSGFDTNVEYVIIPNPEDGQYVIAAQGTEAGGVYILSTSYVDNAEIAETNVSGTLNGGVTTQVLATLDSTSAEPVVLEQSLSDLIANLRNVVQGLEISDKQKMQLLKKVANIEKNIEKQIKKQSNALSRLDTQIQKKAENGKIDADAAAEIAALLDELIAGSAMVMLDKELLNQLKEEIKALNVKSSFKNALLKKVERLENLATLNRSLARMITVVERKENKGDLPEADAENVLNVLKQIQSAL